MLQFFDGILMFWDEKNKQKQQHILIIILNKLYYDYDDKYDETGFGI